MYANPHLKNDEIGIQQTVNHILDANARFQNILRLGVLPAELICQ